MNMMMETDRGDRVYTFPYYGRTVEVKLTFDRYSDNASLAVSLMCRLSDIDEEVLEDDDYEYDPSGFDAVLAALTVNLEDSAVLPFGEQFIDVETFPQLAMWLVDNELAVPTGSFSRSGKVIYPVFRFNLPLR